LILHKTNTLAIKNENVRKCFIMSQENSFMQQLNCLQDNFVDIWDPWELATSSPSSRIKETNRRGKEKIESPASK